MTYYGQEVEIDGELQGHTQHYTCHQLKYHISSFQFLWILPENIDFIGKAEKIGKLPKILILKQKKNHLWLCNLCVLQLSSVQGERASAHNAGCNLN